MGLYDSARGFGWAYNWGTVAAILVNGTKIRLESNAQLALIKRFVLHSTSKHIHCLFLFGSMMFCKEVTCANVTEETLMEGSLYSGRAYSRNISLADRWLYN